MIAENLEPTKLLKTVLKIYVCYWYGCSLHVSTLYRLYFVNALKCGISFFSVKYYKNDCIFIHVLVYLNFSHDDNVGNDLSNCSSNM